MASFLARAGDASFARSLRVLPIFLHINTLLPLFTENHSSALANTGYFCHKALLKPEPDANAHIYQKVRDGMNRILNIKGGAKI
jgi:hypothetical protein